MLEPESEDIEEAHIQQLAANLYASVKYLQLEAEVNSVQLEIFD